MQPSTINLGPSGLVDSAFGPAKNISNEYKEAGAATGRIEIYYVDCDIKGTGHLQGRIRYTIKDGLSVGNAGMNGNINAGLQLCIDAEAEYYKVSTFPIASQGIP